jgi:hypothetical protein
MKVKWHTGDAEISECGKYRYALRRRWGDHMSLDCAFVMLNPSTADAKTDDATIRRCMQFASDWGFGGIFVANLYAYRATDPKALKALGAVLRFGPGNDWALHRATRDYPRVVFAWGGNRLDELPSFRSYDNPPLCFGKTKSGEPLHPLYQPSDAALLPYYAQRLADAGSGEPHG